MNVEIIRERELDLLPKQKGQPDIVTEYLKLFWLWWYHHPLIANVTHHRAGGDDSPFETGPAAGSGGCDCSMRS